MRSGEAIPLTLDVTALSPASEFRPGQAKLVSEVCPVTPTAFMHRKRIYPINDLGYMSMTR
jgi:hypothetical protein